MNSQGFTTLDFSKILEYLASFAVSEAGQVACAQVLPLRNLEQIRERQAFHEEGQLLLMSRDYTLSPFPPLDDFLVFVESSSASPDLDALWALRRVLTEIKKLIDFISQPEGNKERSSWPLWTLRCENTPFPAQVASALGRCISDDAYIKDSASPELALVRNEIRNLHRQCTTKVKDFATEYNIMHYLQDDFMTLSSDRYVLPLKTNFKGRLQGIIHDYSQTGETCYFEPIFLVEINNQLQELKREEYEEEKKILAYLGGLVRAEIFTIRAAYELLVDIDVLQAQCALGQCLDGHMVDVEDGAPVLLRDARHPLLVLSASPRAEKSLAHYRHQQIVKQGGVPDEASDEQAGRQAGRQGRRVEPIPSTIELRSDERALIISGGNAGGKTVSLKTLGLIALMTNAGLPVSAGAGSSLPVWENIHAFIGDDQSLEDHVSTFTAQITHLSSIWSKLGPRDLVILDEFGAGTDPAQGAALAQAVIDSLLEYNSYVIAATHFPALKAYALSTPKVRSASVLFDPATKKPLFKLVYEQVGASLALDVAREHGLPIEVINRAEKYLLDSGSDTSALVARLNELAVERERELEGLKKEQNSYQERRKKLTEHYERDKQKLFDSIQNETKKILDSWKKDKLTNKQTLKELNKLKTTLVADDEPDTPQLHRSAIVEGAKVMHRPWNRVGSILEIDERKERVRLDLDGVSLWTSFKDLSDIGGSGKAKGGASTAQGKDGDKASGASSTKSQGAGQSSAASVLTSPSPKISLALDLRGKRADIAIQEMYKFLDDALLQGQHSLEIIHGRGTGVLRREVHAALKELPFIASFNLAPENLGGDGMTMVELK